ncbi:MAG: DUF3842 family protein [Clostridia bacterium]|nr:DUF3842 family protein [Clostridia bacterium]
MKVVVIDAQGGRIGRQLVAEIKKSGLAAELVAVGTNSAATAAMLAAGADAAATGENAVAVACRTADFILGPVGIAIADSMLGEITPRMAAAVGQSAAQRILIPFDNCGNVIVGASLLPVSKRIRAAAELLLEAAGKDAAHGQ